jgi:uncharacterized protein (DUF952 family)
MSDRIVYKVLLASEMAALLAGTFKGAPVDLADGFVHLSTAAQVDETVSRHFAGQDNLFIAAVDLALLGDAPRWEASRHGQLFPHLYGDLTLASVVAHGPLGRDSAGRIRLPAKYDDF